MGTGKPTTLTEEQVFENLCWHDPRNPNYTEMGLDDDEKIEPRFEDCCCDNCFYGKDKLAMEILRLREKHECIPV